MSEEEKLKQKIPDKEREKALRKNVRAREGMAKLRSHMSEEEKERRKSADRVRKSEKRKQLSESEKNADRVRKSEKRKQLSESEKEKMREADRKRKSKKRKEQRDDASSEVKRQHSSYEREYNKLYKQNVRKNRPDPEIEYELIANLLNMREMRKARSGKDHLLDNLNAKIGMRLAKEEGYLMPFEQRSFRDLDETELWKKFGRRGTNFMEVLKVKMPEKGKEIENIIWLENKARDEKEAEKQRFRDKGFWEYNYDTNDFTWTGKNPPTDEDEPNPATCQIPLNTKYSCEENLTEEEWKELQRKWSQEQFDEMALYYKEEKNRKARESYQRRKEALQTPIEWKEETELSEYEKIRESNIREREGALAAAGFTWKLS